MFWSIFGENSFTKTFLRYWESERITLCLVPCTFSRTQYVKKYIKKSSRQKQYNSTIYNILKIYISTMSYNQFTIFWNNKNKQIKTQHFFFFYNTNVRCCFILKGTVVTGCLELWLPCLTERQSVRKSSHPAGGEKKQQRFVSNFLPERSELFRGGRLREPPPSDTSSSSAGPRWLRSSLHGLQSLLVGYSKGENSPRPACLLLTECGGCAGVAGCLRDRCGSVASSLCIYAFLIR